MSRDYDEYCHRCKNCDARSDNLEAGYKLFQCQRCGFCWYEITTVRELKTSGITNEVWKTAMKEAYLSIDAARTTK